jgi:hypothetical protein
MTDDNGKRGWPLQLSFLERPPSAFSVPVSVVGISLFVALMFIALLAVGWLLADLMSGEQRRAAEAAKAALPLLAGAVGLPLIIWRLRILDRQTRISEEKTQIDRETHYTSIFSRGIEQLGQTREIKRTVQSAAGSVDTTTTVPNIEVRLGGIHSLARLSEESIRDRDKIGNILRSYVRENSWSDRTGELTSKPNWPRNSPLSWAYTLSSDPSGTAALAAKNAWIKSIEQCTHALHEWGNQIPETRVDVNEAADAIAIQSISDPQLAKPVFYECLFVGRHFSSRLLALVNFRRCTFVRCSFESELTTFEIEDSFILDTNFSCMGAQITISNSQLSEIWFSRAQDAQISVTGCDAYSMRIVGRPLIIDLADCVLYRLRLMGRVQNQTTSETTISLSDSFVVLGMLRHLTLPSESNLNLEASPDVQFSRVNLHAVTAFDKNILDRLRADGETIHPQSSDRPSSWPKLTKEATGHISSA